MANINLENDSDRKQRVGVIGMGPVGMILAVKLQEAGFEVAICEKDPIKVSLIRKDGIQLEGVLKANASFDHIFSCLSEFEEFQPKILIFALKTHQMGFIFDESALLDQPDLSVVSAQNGIDSEDILAKCFGEAKTIRMVINFAGNLSAPNLARVNFFNPPNYLASIDDSRESVANHLAHTLTSVGILTQALNSFEIIPRIWEKTILNASLSALCGIGKLTIKEAMQMPDTAEIVEQVIAEAVDVAEAEKIKFDDDFIRKCMRYLKKAGDHFPSLAVDLMNNSPTEIDFLNGKIVQYGRKHYLRTSLNLMFTNMVKAMTHKHLSKQLGNEFILSSIKGQSGLNIFNKGNKAKRPPSGDCFLGIDLGSAYTKFIVIDQNENIIFKSLLRTHNRRKIAINHVVESIYSEFPIKHSCATGYGRKHFSRADLVKSEIHCAAVGAAKEFPGEKCIIDIGGEDLKVILCDDRNVVENFYMNDKCAAGTGSFLTEVAERAEISISEMSPLAAKSEFKQELNSFCTVFAKTEIMNWLFDGINIENICKGLYHSIVNRVAKMRVDLSRPILMIGGVIAHHPYLLEMLHEKFGVEVNALQDPQHIAAFGAARMAKHHFLRQEKSEQEEKLSTH